MPGEEEIEERFIEMLESQRDEASAKGSFHGAVSCFFMIWYTLLYSYEASQFSSAAFCQPFSEFFPIPFADLILSACSGFLSSSSIFAIAASIVYAVMALEAFEEASVLSTQILFARIQRYQNVRDRMRDVRFS
ncbi:hypothetical protein B9Z55_005748 [Caenorhabditis nigoni]|uniref:Uncharacterized protein n=1 Tax=Caenorhabditis nigoni TaxID=1611254 RepID=A0A2G5V254_9PELO|nr:hypothetical protein B9Z55_005748 [Caenorhabditis nigoni]